MILSCPSCGASFNVKPDALGAAGRKVKCSKCGHQWHALPSSDALEPEPSAFQTPPEPIPPPQPDPFANFETPPEPAMPADPLLGTEPTPDAEAPAESLFITEPTQDFEAPAESLFINEPAPDVEAPAEPAMAAEPEPAPPLPIEPAVSAEPLAAPMLPQEPAVADDPIPQPQRGRGRNIAAEFGGVSATASPQDSGLLPESFETAADQAAAPPEPLPAGGSPPLQEPTAAPIAPIPGTIPTPNPAADGFPPPPIAPVNRPNPRDHAKVPGRGRAALVSLLLLLVVMGAVGSAAYFMQSEVVMWLPWSKKIYAIAGLKPDTLGQGLHIAEPKPEKNIAGNDEILQVTGHIDNTSRRPITVPLLRGALLDAAGNEIRVWTFRANKAEIAPGERVEYATEFRNPPAKAKNLDITFTRPGETGMATTSKKPPAQPKPPRAGRKK